jgi:hypothetical protein
VKNRIRNPEENVNKHITGTRAAFLSSQGAAFSGCLLFLVVIAVLGYAGFKIGEPCWEYLEMREKVREALNWAVAGAAKSDAEILQKILVKTENTNVDIRQQNIKIIHEAKLLTIAVSWKREVIFPGYTLPLRFRVSLSEEKRWSRGGLILK